MSILQSVVNGDTLMHKGCRYAHHSLLNGKSVTMFEVLRSFDFTIIKPEYERTSDGKPILEWLEQKAFIRFLPVEFLEECANP